MISDKTLLVLGAGYYNRRVFTQIKELGCRVIATDRSPEAPGFAFVDHHEVVDIADAHGTLEVARRLGIDGIMAINDFGVPTAAYVAREMSLPGITSEAAIAATDKAVMRDAWRDADLPIPAYRSVSSPEEAHNACREIGLPVVIKPANSGGGGRGVSVVRSEDEVEWAFHFAEPFLRGSTALVEEFMDGIEMTIEALTREGHTQILAMSDKYKPPLRYRVATSLNYPAFVPKRTLDLVAEIVRDAVKALGVTVGATHTEVIVTGDGPKLVEMAARPGGGHIFSHIVLAVSGVNMPQELAKLLTGEPADITPKFQKGCVYRFFNPPAGVIRDIRGLEEAQAMPGVLDVAVTRKPGDRIGDLANSFERSGMAVVAGRDRDEAVARADAVERRVVFVMDPEHEAQTCG